MDLIVKLSGEITETNFEQYKDEVLRKIDEVNTDLKTDEDFVIAEESVKSCKAAEVAIDEAREAALDQTKDIRELFEMMTEVSQKLQDTRLDLTKKIKTRKEELKEETIKDGINTLKEKIKEYKADPFAVTSFPINDAAIRHLVKGKRKLDSMKKAVKKEVFRQLEVFSQHEKGIAANRATITTYKEKYPTLFFDDYQLLTKSADELEGIISARIKQHEAEEETRRLQEEKAALEKKEVSQETPAPSVETKPPVSPKSTLSKPHFAPEVKTHGQEQTPVASFVMTVIINGTKDQAVDVAKTVHAALEPFGDVVESVNLNNRN